MYKKLYNYLKESGAFLITSPHSLRYFTNFSGGEGIAVIGMNFNVLITDSRYTEAAEKEAEDFKIIQAVPYVSALKELLKENGINKIYYEEEFLTVKSFEEIKNALGESFNFEPASSIAEDLRIIKSDDELECIKKAEAISSEAYEYVLGKIREGMSELELAAELEYYMKKSGAYKTSFDTIVLFGNKTSMPHGISDDTKLKCGDFITMDFGCIYNGYCSDMTRTVVFGKASEKQKEIYNVVLEAQLKALEFLEVGKKAKDADKIARDIISDAGYGKFFGHSLGHGVGLLIHEAPNLSPKSEYILEKNMVVSCEPGIYIPDFGGVRIEDLVVIKDGGIINLTSADKKFTEI